MDDDMDADLSSPAISPQGAADGMPPPPAPPSHIVVPDEHADAAFTPRGSSVTDSPTASSASHERHHAHAPYHPPSPRATHAEAKYRTARAVSPLRRLPRGFVWSDPDSAAAYGERLDGAAGLTTVTEIPGRTAHPQAKVTSKAPPSCTSLPGPSPKFCGVRVPENTVYLVERAGVYHRTLEPGFRMLVPGLDRVAFVFSKKMQKLTFATSHVHTGDRVALKVHATLFYIVDDPVAAAYAVENMRDALIDLAAAAIHDEFARVSVDALFNDLDTMWGKVAQQLNDACGVWGTRCIRLFTAIRMPQRLAKTYERLVQARLEREIVDTSDQRHGEEAHRRQQRRNQRAAMASEGRAVCTTNDAEAERDAIVMIGEANARALDSIADALQRPAGRDAARVWIASKYIDALNTGLQKNRGSISIDGAGPARIVDDAMNIMDGRISRTRSNRQALSNSNESALSVCSPPRTQQAITTPPLRSRTHATSQTHAAAAGAGATSRSATPPPPQHSPPSQRWHDARFNAHVASESAARSDPTARIKSSEKEDFSLGGSRFLNTHPDPNVPGRLPSPGRPPRPPSRHVPNTVTGEEVLALAERRASSSMLRVETEAATGASPTLHALNRTLSGESQQSERRSSGAALVRAAAQPKPRTASGTSEASDIAIERVASGATTIEQPSSGALVSQVSEDEPEPSAIRVTLAEVRAESASAAAISGWNAIHAQRARARRKQGGAGVPPPRSADAAAAPHPKSPFTSNVTEDEEAAQAQAQAPKGHRRASLEFRRKRRGPKGGTKAAAA